jgi:glutathione S-transferase
MPVDPKACVRISAFNWVPPFAQGYVRDLRVRWALEEAGIPYTVRKLNAATDRPADYFEEQPFGQVPSYRDGNISLFESGAIVLHIGRDCEALLPPDDAARARATAWLIAALNSVEPFVMQLTTIDIFCAGESWAKERRPAVVEMIGKRLARLADALGDKSYLDGDAFTAGDLMMTSVLRSLDGKDLIERHSNLVAYEARCLARPAFKAALAAQLADFERREAVPA